MESSNILKPEFYQSIQQNCQLWQQDALDTYDDLDNIEIIQKAEGNLKILFDEYVIKMSVKALANHIINNHKPLLQQILNHSKVKAQVQPQQVPVQQPQQQQQLPPQQQQIPPKMQIQQNQQLPHHSRGKSAINENQVPQKQLHINDQLDKIINSKEPVNINVKIQNNIGAPQNNEKSPISKDQISPNQQVDQNKSNPNMAAAQKNQWNFRNQAQNMPAPFQQDEELKNEGIPQANQKPKSKRNKSQIKGSVSQNIAPDQDDQLASAAVIQINIYKDMEANLLRGIVKAKNKVFTITDQGCLLVLSEDLLSIIKSIKLAHDLPRCIVGYDNLILIGEEKFIEVFNADTLDKVTDIPTNQRVFKIFVRFTKIFTAQDTGVIQIFNSKTFALEYTFQFPKKNGKPCHIHDLNIVSSQIDNKIPEFAIATTEGLYFIQLSKVDISHNSFEMIEIPNEFYLTGQIVKSVVEGQAQQLIASVVGRLYLIDRKQNQVSSVDPTKTSIINVGQKVAGFSLTKRPYVIFKTSNELIIMNVNDYKLTYLSSSKFQDLRGITQFFTIEENSQFKLYDLSFIKGQKRCIKELILDFTKLEA
ncbi:UNKNOWN [Stylonychia lemnae]|uniref:Uncharacterized protein n=1 Tax=Stylonychia lemnae TaxID=5949 RepID=A0A078A5F1_STYLE|nr:UNKNOWN [Stylonychia lemnae]|eukprot:CDW77460.1 UNKNOWN [Stylonychia lemnae]